MLTEPIRRAAIPVSHRIYDRFVDTGSAVSLSTSFRNRRWQMLHDRFGDLAAMDVLDLGGTAESWSLSPVRPAHLTIVNLTVPEGEVPRRTEVVAGDVCTLGSTIGGRSWDLVYSNSVIEHLGGHDRRVAFAESVRSLAPHHWVQTPNRYFPIEPHFLVPGLQFLPAPAQASVIARWPLNKWRPPDRRTALQAALELQLIGRTELAFLFPDSDILDEHLGPLTKSFVATQ